MSWRFVVLRHSVAYDQWMVNIVTAHEDLELLRPLAEDLMEKHPLQISNRYRDRNKHFIAIECGHR